MRPSTFTRLSSPIAGAGRWENKRIQPDDDMGHHKHKISELPDDIELEASQTSSTEVPLISPNRLGRELGSRNKSSNGATSSSARHGAVISCAAPVKVLPCGCRSGT
jgi:hypothetical protein